MLQEVGAHRTAQSSFAVLAAPDERAVLEALAEVGVAFTNERQLDPVLDRLLGTALRVVRADAGSIMLLSRERDTLVVVAARGPRARTILGTRQPADRSVPFWVRASRPTAASRVGHCAPARRCSCMAALMLGRVPLSRAPTIRASWHRRLPCHWP